MSIGLFAFGLAAVVVVVCGLAWTTIVRRRFAGLPVVPFAERRPAPWRGLDLFLIAVFFLLANLVFAMIFSYFLLPAKQAAAAGDLRVALSAGTAANLTAVAFALLWLFSHTATMPEDLGWRPDKLGGDLCLGLIAFAAVAPPIYGLQWLLSHIVEQQHPIVELLPKQPSPALYALAAVSAVVVAPLAEELFFRVLLQGWLESALWPGEQSAEGEAPLAPRPPRPMAIVMTSALFAALHLGHGAAPVPLFCLSLALGYLYQRTHRLLPCWTVHFCLNACSFAMLCLLPTEAKL